MTEPQAEPGLDRRSGTERRWASQPAGVTLAGIILLWIFLFANNLSSVRRSAGFDVDGHLEYISYIQKHHALPLAADG